MSLSTEELTPIFALLGNRHTHRAMLDHALVIQGDYFVCGHCKEHEEFVRNLLVHSCGLRCARCSHRLYLLARIEPSNRTLSLERMAELAQEYGRLEWLSELTFVGRVDRSGDDLYLDQVYSTKDAPTVKLVAAS